MDILLSNFFLIGLLVLFVFVAIFKVLNWVYIWQLKEYRSDRMKDFLSTRSGRRATLNIFTIGELIAIMVLFYSFSIVAPAVRSEYVGLLVGGYLVFLFLQALVLLRRRARPTWTLKAILISTLSIVVTIALPFLLEFSLSLLTLIALTLFLIPVGVSFLVLLLQPITTVQKQKIIHAAKEKMKDLNPIVIGVTGIYGKTTTKEYLNHMLSRQFSVLATPKNVNVDIGVAQTILRDLNTSHEVFIVEMGAYKEGEIEAICDIVSPIIGVLTAINGQHLSLFGSVEAIQRTKGELLRSLPASGVAVVNGDIEACVQVGNEVTAKAKFFSSKDVAHAYSSDVVVHPHDVQFTMHIGNESQHVRARLYGKQVISSILASATVAHHLGVPMSDIVAAIGELETVDGTMHLRRGLNNSTIIDDSYNTNPDGFLAALDYLALFKEKRKIVVTPGMLELGTESDAKHRTVGARVGEVADMLVVTKKDSAHPLAVAASQTGLQESEIIVNDSPRQLMRGVLSTLSDSDVVVIEGRVAQALRDFLIEE